MRLKKDTTSKKRIKRYLGSKTFQRFLIALITIAAAFIIIENGAEPKKYRIQLGEKSFNDITAPRDVENKVKTLQLAEAAAKAVPPVMLRLDNVPIDVLNEAVDFISNIENARKSVTKSLQEQGVTKKDKNYKQKLELEQAVAAKSLTAEISSMAIPLSEEQIKYLVAKITDEELDLFKKITREFISSIMKEEINSDNLTMKVDSLQTQYQSTLLTQEMKNIGSMLAKTVLLPNSIVDTELTEKRKKDAYKTATESRQIIAEGSRIISYGDVVTADKLEVLKELNLVETDKFDYLFALGIFIILLLLAIILILYMNFFCKKILNNRDEVILISVIILMTLVLARVLSIYSPLMIPIFIAPLLISILIDIKLAVIINFVLSLSISFIVKGDTSFLFMALISGTYAAFIISRANQRSKMSAAGMLIGAINAVIIVCVGILNKSGVKTVAYDSLTVAINGVVSTIFTIGMLPFLESAFNIITPLKLLELANPNQPLIKRLLMEAPGTYHHSLMVGNLAEVATETINGNALLARVGAYYHDVGKLKRPNFFKENQLSDNPHDRMTANLSTLVITSHTQDGMEIAEKYKVPFAIKEIIRQHHGTTLVAYFYHKAGKGDKNDGIKPEDYRYTGPKPSSKEAAVVMLADSVEAAVRSMVDKTEGKIEGLVRKIIKDKLDDGQLDQCELTLKDLDEIARAFMRVFSGYFHEREEYPEVKLKKIKVEDRMAADSEDEDIISESRINYDMEAAEGSPKVEGGSGDDEKADRLNEEKVINESY